MNDRIRRMLGCVALALACIMIGSGMSHTFAPAATAEESVQRSCTQSGECQG